MNEARLNEILEFVKEGHAGQFDLKGVPYHEHLEAVANRVRGFCDEALVALALGHDYAEDVKSASEKLAHSPFTAYEISMIWAARAPKAPRGVDYTSFYLKSYIQDQIIAFGDPRLLLMKMSDNLHNSDPERSVGFSPKDFRRLVRYKRSLELCSTAYMACKAHQHSDFEIEFMSEVESRIESLKTRIENWPAPELAKASGPSF